MFLKAEVQFIYFILFLRILLSEFMIFLPAGLKTTTFSSHNRSKKREKRACVTKIILDTTNYNYKNPIL